MQNYHRIVAFLLGLVILIIPIMFSQSIDSHVYNMRVYYRDTYENLQLGGLMIKWLYDHAAGLGTSCMLIILFSIGYFFKELPEILKIMLAIKAADVITDNDDEK